MIARLFTGLWILLAWLFGFLLALVILFLGHELLMVFVVNTLHWGKNVVPLVHILYYITGGMLLVIYFVLSMDYLNQSAQEGMLLKTSLVTIGTPLIIIGLTQAALTLYGFLPADTLGVGLMAAEELAGMGALFIARRLKERSPELETKEQKRNAGETT
jgi:hypothetical protein